MKNCKHFLNNISAYIDNELDTNDRCEFENHIKNCSSCQSEFNRILLISDSLCENKVEAPEGFMSSLKARIAQEEVYAEKKKGFFTYFNFRTCSALFAICLLAVSFKTPLYDNILNHRNESYYQTNTTLVEKDNQKEKDLTEAKFTVIDNGSSNEKDTKVKKEITSVKQDEPIYDGFIDVPTPSSVVNADMSEHERTEDLSQSDIVQAPTAKLADESPVYNAHLAKNETVNTDEDYTLEERNKTSTSSGGGGSGGSSAAIKNTVSLTVLNNNEATLIIEKYFGSIEILSYEMTYENYLSLKNELNSYIVSTDESVINEDEAVKIEIFLR